MLGIAEVLRPVDDVLAVVVDVELAAVGDAPPRRRRAPSRRPSACRATPVVWPKPSSRVVSTITSMRLGSMPSSCDRDLQRDGVHALAHLGPAVAHLDRAVGCGSARRPGTSPEAVAEAGVLEPEPETDRLAVGACRVVDAA